MNDRGLTLALPTAPTYVVVATEQVQALVAGAEKAMIDAPVIVDETTRKAVQKVVRDAKATFNTVNAARELAKAPFLEACRRIDDAARPLLNLLNEVMTEGKNQQAVYLTERDRKLAAEDAQRKANEVLAAQDTSRPTAPLVLISLPEPVTAPLTTGRRVVIKDANALPRQYLMPDVARITADALAGVSIPGVEVVLESSVVAR
jgi:predicted RNase H-like nuclease